MYCDSVDLVQAPLQWSAYPTEIARCVCVCVCVCVFDCVYVCACVNVNVWCTCVSCEEEDTCILLCLSPCLPLPLSCLYPPGPYLIQCV